MGGDEPALSLHSGVERRDVAVSDDRFRRARQCVVVDARKNADHSVAATKTPERVDRWIPQGAVNVVQSVAVAARQVSDPFRRVRRDDRFPAEGARVFLRARKFFRFLQWTSWSDERDARSRAERLRATVVFYRHRIVICGANYAVSLLSACFNMAHALLFSLPVTNNSGG